jgi:hypothetical protein
VTGGDGFSTRAASATGCAGAARTAHAACAPDAVVQRAVGAAAPAGAACAARRTGPAVTADASGPTGTCGWKLVADDRLATLPAGASGLACDRARLSGPANTAGDVAAPAHVIAWLAVCRRCDGRGGRVLAVGAGQALATLSAFPAIADQPGATAVATPARGGSRGGVRADPACTAVAEQARTAAVASGATVDACESGSPGAAAAEQQATAPPVLACRPLVAVADEQTRVGILGRAVADEDRNQCGDRIRHRARRGWDARNI